MNKFSIKALGACILSIGLMTIGIAAPAQASEMTGVTATTATPLQQGQINASPIVVTFTSPTAIPAAALSQLTVGFTGASGFTSMASCGSVVSVATTPTPNMAACQTITTNSTSVMLSSGANAGISWTFTVAANTLTMPATGSGLDVRMRTMTGPNGSPPTTIDTTTVQIPFGNVAPTPVTAAVTLSATPGQLVAGSSVAIVASGLQTTAAYDVVVRSTPQTIGSGNAVSGAVNSTATIPSGLEAGWHSLTFNSTAADGSAVTSVSYFKVSASGTLLATSTTIPAELANTGFDGVSYLATGGMLALAGATIMLFARRRFGN